MANISSAHGTLTLKGNWTQEALDAFLPVLDCWSFYGEYGIQSHGPLTLENPKTYFSGCGRWSFRDTLESFDQWTRDWIAEHPDNTSHPLTAQRYERLLSLMEEQKLVVYVEYIDCEEGARFEVNEVGQFLSSGKFYFLSGFKTSLYPDCVCEDGAGLTSVTIPSKAKTIRKYSFYGRRYLTSVTIPEGVEEIGHGAFSLCKSLTDVVIPKSVRKIGDFAFSYTGLTHIAIPEGVTEIGCYAFTRTGLTHVTIPEGVERIDWNAFQKCKNLTSVTLASSTVRIVRDAFADCVGLTSVTILKKPKSFERGAFRRCTSLTSVTVSEDVSKINRALFDGCDPVFIAPHIPIGNYTAEDKPGAVRDFARLYWEEAEMDEEIRAEYLKYIKSQRKKLCPLAVEHEELLRLMLAEKMFPRKDIGPLLEECDKQNNATAKTAVMDYINTL